VGLGTNSGARCTGPTSADSTGSLSPPEFLAISLTPSFLPTSASTGVYSDLVAPPITAHSLPSELQRNHSYLNSVGLLVHSSWTAFRVLPWRASPSISGGLVFVGFSASTGPATASPCSL